MLRRRELVAVAVVAGMLAAACNSDASGDSERDPGGGSAPDDAAVAWAGKVCESLWEGGEALGEAPAPDSADPLAARDAVLDFLGNVHESLTGLEGTLEDLGEPPVRGGPEVYGEAMATLEDTQSAVARSIDELDAAEIVDGESFEAAMERAGETFAELDTLDGPAGEFRQNDDLRAAMDEAPECRSL
ncbi:hypothetical protein [Haloechinothrix sp. LS1_15]|uniref:hypothetical protein n=1 Tax=Haloechinothrix sp. LS1_15 TaxID=2652248 RepID=UPI002947D7F5|nr:hypothetical protein [Haloechinothrix sp. LS1_15]MDV6011448.1 hypothetical protein [Haloechinothrix sp. LS1_15]